MSQRTIQTSTPSRAHALDEFLPERLFDMGVRGDGERDIVNHGPALPERRPTRPD